MKVTRIVMAGLLLAACGGDDDAPPTIDRAEVVVIDGGGNPGDPDAAEIPVTCTAEETYSGGALTGGATTLPQDPAAPAGPQKIGFQAALNQDGMPDVIFIELWDGYGPFADGLTTGTFDITGDEASYDTCGACVLVLTDVDTATGEQTDIFMAESGTITLTSVAGNITGSVSNISLRHVQLAGGQTDDPSGCDTVITDGTFDAAIEMP